MNRDRHSQLHRSLSRLISALRKQESGSHLHQLILKKMGVLFAELKLYENPNHIFGVPLERYPLIEPLNINPRNN